MNAGTIIVALLLVIVVALDIRYLMRKGISQCGGDCAKCTGTCRWSEDLKRARTEISEEKQKNLRKTV